MHRLGELRVGHVIRFIPGANSPLFLESLVQPLGGALRNLCDFRSRRRGKRMELSPTAHARGELLALRAVALALNAGRLHGLSPAAPAGGAELALKEAALVSNAARHHGLSPATPAGARSSSASAWRLSQADIDQSLPQIGLRTVDLE